MNDTETQIWRPSAALNPERLDYLWKLTERIAVGTSVPETLRGEREGHGQASRFKSFDDRTVLANVFMVVEQADRWNISPFALLQAASIVRGKLCFEGKVVAGVLESQFGVELHTYFRGTPRTDDYRIFLCDEELPEDVLAELTAGYRHDQYRILDGSVAEWKTTGNGSPWRPATFTDMLTYRGVRQWVRVYKSKALIGVIADDEVQYPALENAAQNAVPIGQRFAPSPGAGQGFAPDNVARAIEHNGPVPMEVIDKETGEIFEAKSEVQSGTAGKPAPTEPQGGKPQASAQPSADADGGADTSRHDDDRPQNSSSATPADGQGGDAGTPARVSADLWRSYHRALARMAKPDSLKKAHEEFWRNGAGKGVKLTHADDTQLGMDMLRVHGERASGQLEPGVVAKEIEDWISKVTAE